MRAFIDADVLIWHLRGETKAHRFLRGLRDKGEYELWTGAMQRAEVVFFMRENEVAPTLQFLSQFKTESVDQSIIDDAGLLFRQWNPSHGIDANDAILAATTKRFGGMIYTLNLKHYPMRDIIVRQAWK
ncbi:MAG: type II toxin-antitoxin system VapC family toxin [Spartobacteria bacterium]|nr:type II toxin-antitoxin system VapC family toxin [Spartobacteria bacterium]